ncbi:choice-of-anchor D domain-containing protein [Marinobacter daepoensis]|uniref:Choice-of-anchor D domain-containing protein n=1 Tax=Marinobacter daepoensis TaxID=262077 RepID=A0ABS3BHL9_9GAMM|nr:choice-of-anchor D domain-containing protein [Marinobacter daepoensis]MBN7771330.1 choice-of-anchor D domain-containing protein [Marinobacter daepoensis]MBY6079931.1 choice-of-anchor D domain-containing protein [Marinobacter daepoensis]
MKLRNLNTSVRKLGPAVAAAALMAGGASNAAAEQVSLELAFECPFPLIGTQPIRAQISADIPPVATVGQPMPQFQVDAITIVNDDARTGLKLVNSETLEGVATSTNEIITVNRNIDQIVKLNIPPTSIPSESGEFNVPASGMAPEVLFTNDDIGQADIRVGALSLELIARTANGDIAPAPIGEITTDCIQLPDQNNLLQTMMVEGDAVETPRINVGVEELAFGNVQAGLPATQTVTISNTGNSDLGINSIAISGADSTVFTQTNSCNTIAPSGSCDVNVTFAPSTEGNRNATLTIQSTDAETPSVDVALTGRGVLAPVPEIGVNPESVNLGRVLLGESANADVTVTNSGNAALQIDSVVLEGANAADFTQATNCTTVAAGESCTVQLAFTAASVGVSNANLVIRSSDSENPEIQVPVTAEAYEPQTDPALELLLGLEGSTLIKATNGTLPLTGSIATLLDLASGTFEADLDVEPTAGNFSIKLLFSKIHASANVEFEQAEITTGSLVNGKLTANSHLYVKVPKVAIKLFGLPVKIGGGEQCQTGQPVDIQLTSVEGSNFSPATGGTVSGVYELPALENCGLLTSLLNQFMTGPGNTIDLQLTPEQ